VKILANGMLWEEWHAGRRPERNGARAHAKVGHFIVNRVARIGYLLKNASCDFVLFDTEHSASQRDDQERTSLLGGAAAGDRPGALQGIPFHRTRYGHGAEGLMVPMVNDAAEAWAIPTA
jgi:2-dehydro-3-deoxyglucarate aldolase/4-hydroxy-2-oxoheptanedioate aldolase